MVIIPYIGAAQCMHTILHEPTHRVQGTLSQLLNHCPLSLSHLFIGSCFTTDNGFGVVVIIAIITIIVELVACIAVTLCCQHQKSKLRRKYKGPYNDNNDTIENRQHT